VIALVGFMGAGKSSVGRVLARRLDTSFADTDDEVETKSAATIAALFADGEDEFRRLERDAVAGALASKPGVLALGGGALGDPATRALLTGDDVAIVHLSVPFEDAMRRVDGGAIRPMLSTADPFELFEARRAVYEDVADFTVDTEGRSPDEVADEIVARLSLSTSVKVDLPGGGYEVVVGHALCEGVGDMVLGLGDVDRAFVVSHPELKDIAGRVRGSLSSSGIEAVVLDVPAGEAEKSLAGATRLYDALAEHAAHRHDLVIGVGGGVVTDLAGFVASTFNRGMRVVHVPTTLLAQVDAAIGGKTAVNLERGKNLVGTFHQPALVVCDVDALATLPPAEFNSGLAEVAKHGFIADPGILDLIGEEDSLVRMVVRSVGVKAAIVAADERDYGRRAILNYGHTFAHAVERITGYKGIRHGEAVAVGMMAAAHLARVIGRLEEGDVDLHRRVLSDAGLPVSANLDLGALEEAWLRDKKFKGEPRFVLLKRIGEAEAGIAAPRAALAEALARLAA
jgi:3-dehydroquinate synthase